MLLTEPHLVAGEDLLQDLWPPPTSSRGAPRRPDFPRPLSNQEQELVHALASSSAPRLDSPWRPPRQGQPSSPFSFSIPSSTSLISLLPLCCHGQGFDTTVLVLHRHGCNPSPSSLDLDQEGPEHLLHRPAIFLEAAAPERSSSSRTAAPANLAAGDHLPQARAASFLPAPLLFLPFSLSAIASSCFLRTGAPTPAMDTRASPVDPAGLNPAESDACSSRAIPPRARRPCLSFPRSLPRFVSL